MFDFKCESHVAPLEFPKVPAIAPHAPGACNDGSSVQHVYEDLRISANGLFKKKRNINHYLSEEGFLKYSN